MSSNVGAVARRYSKALWLAAEGVSEAKGWLVELREFSKIIESSPELKQALFGYSLDEQKKTAILKSVLQQAKASPSIERFLLSFFGAGRMSVLNQTADAFERMIDAQEKLLSCEIETAFALDSAQKERLKKKLEEVLSAKVKMTERVEPKLVAGLRAKVIGSNGDVVKVLDGSFATNLDVLKRSLSRESARA